MMISFLIDFDWFYLLCVCSSTWTYRILASRKSLYSTRTRVRVGLFSHTKFHKQHEMYMANASPNTRGPNATYIPPALIRLLVGYKGICVWSARRFQIPKCWFRQRKSLALRGPKVRGFVLRWNIGLTLFCSTCSARLLCYWP